MILVTGATGGLGRSLVEALAGGDERVRATGRNLPVGQALALAGAEFLPADLASDDLAPLVAGVDTIFHLAALSAPHGARDLFERANVLATRRLTEAATRAGVRRLAFTSTPAIYAEKRERLGIREQDPVAARFANSYAATKYEAEQHVARVGRDGPLRTIIIRPRAIIGPHDQVLLPRLLAAVRGGVLRLPGGGQALVEPTDVGDVISALLAARTHCERLSGEAFNISGGVPIAFRDLAAAAFAALGRTVRIRAVPVGVALAAARASEALARLLGRAEAPLTPYAVMVAAFSQTFDLTKARRELDWRPLTPPRLAVARALNGGGPT